MSSCLRAGVLQFGSRLGERPGREDLPGFPAPALAADAELSRTGGAERLAGAALSRALERDPAWHTAQLVCRCLGTRAVRADIGAAGLRRLRRAKQTCLAYVPRPLRVQSQLSKVR